MTTFYVAGPFALGPTRIRGIARRLHGLGHEWSMGHDWTRSNGGVEADLPPSDEMIEEVRKDLEAVVAADLFVALLPEGHLIRGTWAEIGARLASGQVVHAIIEGADHLFLWHAAVIRHRSVDDFVRRLGWLGPKKGG